MVILICEDATHLGGPMGTEYTTPLWAKSFDDVAMAKRYAEKHFKKRIDWCGHAKSWSADVGCYIYNIVKDRRKK
jgi:hypothetical protein